jgi:hypothetical protein
MYNVGTPDDKCLLTTDAVYSLYLHHCNDEN